MHEGTFKDGPLDGLTYTIRSTVGVLAVSEDSDVAWLYAAAVDPSTPEDAARTYNLVLDSTTDPTTGARVFDEDKAVAAAEAGYDIVVDPDPAPTQEEIDEEEVITDGE